MGLSTTSEPSLGTRPGRAQFHWRRLFQFGVRGLLILTTLVAIAVGWWSNSARRQRQAVSALKKVGADVHYDFQMYQVGHRPTSENLIWPTWVVDALGVDYFASVEMVTMPSSTKDGDLRPLLQLAKLDFLILDDTRITDAGLSELARTSTIEVLSLERTAISDAGLWHLQKLRELKFLYLKRTQITDAGLNQLRELPALVWLDVGETRVTSAGVAQLAQSRPSLAIFGSPWPFLADSNEDE